MRNLTRQVDLNNSGEKKRLVPGHVNLYMDRTALDMAIYNRKVDAVRSITNLPLCVHKEFINLN